MTASAEAGLGVASILRLLWRARVLVAAGAVVALLLSTLLVYNVSLGAPPSFEVRGQSIGVASSQVLVDSRSSQSVDLGEHPVLIDIPGLIARARLLANLIATSPLKDRIAARAGIDPQSFLAAAPSVGFDSPKPSPATSAGGQLNVMNVTFNEALPIVTINAEAADEQTAARISSAAATELRDYLTSLTVRDQVRDAQQLVVKPLGAADSATVHRGPRRLTALMAFAFLLGLWCAAIVVVTRIRRLREAPPAAAGVTVAPRTVLVGLSRPAASVSRSAPPPATVSALPERPERPERPRRGVSA